MPQMSPLMWFLLFIMFSMMLMLFNQMNFFLFKINPIKMVEKEKIKTKKFNWKW